MMNRIYSTLSLVCLSLFVLFTLAFCKKDTVEVEQILQSGHWIQYAYLTDDDNDGVFTDSSLPCEFGDGWSFGSDHQFELRDEVEYCDTDADTVAIISGTWTLLNNDSEIRVDIGDGFLISDFKIQSINDTLMELRLYNDASTQAPPEERFILKR